MRPYQFECFSFVVPDVNRIQKSASAFGVTQLDDTQFHQVVLKGTENPTFAQFQISQAILFSYAVKYRVSFKLFLDECDLVLSLNAEKIVNCQNSKTFRQGIGLFRNHNSELIVCLYISVSGSNKFFDFKRFLAFYLWDRLVFDEIEYQEYGIFSILDVARNLTMAKYLLSRG